MSGQRPPSGDDRPSDAVLDELLRAFEADDLSQGSDLDLSSPEVEALLSGDISRPAAQSGATDDGDASDDDGASDDSGGGPDGAGDSSDGRPETLTPARPARRPVSGGHTRRDRPSVVIDADDGSDDPVHIDGELGADESPITASKTVFIDDGEAPDNQVVGSAEAARATGIEPKLQERRIAVRKAEGRKRLRWVFVVAGVVVLLFAGFAVLGSSVFSIDRVEVEGAVQSRGDALDEIIDDLRDENVWRVDTGAYERRLKQLPYVGDVRIGTRPLRGRATVEISEREPVATFQGDDGRFRLIDVEGRVLEVLDGQPVEYALVTTHDDEGAPNIEPGSFADPGFGSAGTFARVLTPLIRERLEAIVVARDGSDNRLQLRGGTEVLLGDGTHPVDKLVRLQTALILYGDALPAQLNVSTNEVTNMPG